MQPPGAAEGPADSPEAQLEQRTIREVTQRAIDFARAHGVTPVASLGNEHTNKSLPTPIQDTISPDFPPGAAYPRTVDNSCICVPGETDGVLGIAALGPSGKKADYSNWGTPENDFSAPGGFFRDWIGTDRYMQVENLNLLTAVLD